MNPPFRTNDGSRHDATEYDRSRYTLTVKQASQQFADRGVPRSPRSVQRFCDHGHIDCISVKGEKTERYFIDPASVELYAHELKAVEQISRVGDDTSRHDATQRDETRHDATERAREEEPAAAKASEPKPETKTSDSDVKHLEDEILHLRIDNRAKEQVINMLRDERVAMASRLEEVNYLLGAAESKMAQLEAPKPVDEEPERDASWRDSDATEGEASDAVIDPEPEAETPPAPEPQPEPEPEPEPEVRRSFLGRIFK